MSRQPNIVVIITDQQRTDTMACYGNEWIQSPHHDALAARSFVFENAYVTQAVCTPARGSSDYRALSAFAWVCGQWDPAEGGDVCLSRR